MSRYIDTDVFDDTVQTLNERGWNITRGEYKRMDRVLFEMPTADVVEVVRCKNCSKKEYCRTSNVWAISPSDDWFCADGERREDDIQRI